MSKQTFHGRGSIALAVGGCCLALLAGCISSRPVPTKQMFSSIRIHVEADPALEPKNQIELPIAGGRTIRVYRSAEITEYDIASHRILRLPDGSTALELVLTEEGAEILEGLTARHIGERLVLVVNDQVVAVMPIRGPIRGGRLLLRSN